MSKLSNCERDKQKYCGCDEPVISKNYVKITTLCPKGTQQGNKCVIRSQFCVNDTCEDRDYTLTNTEGDNDFRCVFNNNTGVPGGGNESVCIKNLLTE